LGGLAALNQVQTLVVEARETEPHTFSPQDTAHYQYQFKWKSPNRVVVKQPQFPFGWTTFIYSGTARSNFDGRVSHNEDTTPAERNNLRSSPYNVYPQFLTRIDEKNRVDGGLDDVIASRNLLKHPFYQHWQAGTLTRERLRPNTIGTSKLSRSSE
jgi:hypothetical protein